MWLNRNGGEHVVAGSTGLAIKAGTIAGVTVVDGEFSLAVRVVFDLSSRVSPSIRKFMTDPKTGAPAVLHWEETYPNAAAAEKAAAGIKTLNEWDQIALAVKTAASWRCEKCGKKCRNPLEKYDTHKRTLTVAHINHTPRDCRYANLVALCAPCHLRYDAPMKALRKLTQNRGKI